MEILALWSGGLDSTFMLKMLSKAGHRVSAGYVEFICNEAKTKRELTAINNLINAGFAKQYNINYLGVIHRADLIGPTLNFVLCLPINLIYGLASSAEDYTEQLAMGYIMGDDAISFLDEFQAIYKSFHPLMVNTPELTFPMTKKKKCFIWNDLEHTYRRLVTWCESSGEQDHCGRCVPCRRMEFEGITIPIMTDKESEGDYEHTSALEA